MQATWQWDKPGFPNTTAECRVADICAQSPDYNAGSNSVTCNVAWTFPDDIYVLLRGQSQDTVFVGVYTSLAAAQAETASALIASYSGLVTDLTDPQDFTLVDGIAAPDLGGFHVATVPVDTTPSNPTWSVWKVAGNAGTPETPDAAAEILEEYTGAGEASPA